MHALVILKAVIRLIKGQAGPFHSHVASTTGNHVERSAYISLLPNPSHRFAVPAPLIAYFYIQYEGTQA